MSIHKYVILSIAKDLLAGKEFCVRLHFCNPHKWWLIMLLGKPPVSLGYIFVTRELGAEIIEVGLQMSYNLCNLPKQISTVNGKTVKYTYFADGTKFKAVDAAGNGFVYTGSLRWSVENGAGNNGLNQK